MAPSRRVVLGVSGGIAAYKAVEVCRRLVDAGVHVAPVLTDDAQRFVGALTFSALASEPARTSLFDGPDPIPHTRLGQSADLVVVAPATAKLLGKYAAGISDDLLTATLLATRAPVLVCPAMHTEMWEHPAVQENLATLRRRGVHVLEPESGRLAGGDVGAGRLADPERIAAAVEALLDAAPARSTGVRVLVTAGGTREPIDAVRVVTNRSSGKQGYAIAEAAAQRGAHVTLVTTVDRAGPARHRGSGASRDRGRDARRRRPGRVPRPGRDRDGRRGRRLPAQGAEPAQDQEGATARPTSCSNRPTTSSSTSARPSAADQVLVGFAAETENLVANADRQAAPASASTSSSATTSRPPTPGSRSTPTGLCSSMPTAASRNCR